MQIKRYKNEKNYIQLKCFKTRELYANKMFQKRDNYMRIKCFDTRQLYGNKNVSKMRQFICE